MNIEDFNKLIEDTSEEQIKQILDYKPYEPDNKPLETIGEQLSSMTSRIDKLEQGRTQVSTGTQTDPFNEFLKTINGVHLKK